MPAAAAAAASVWVAGAPARAATIVSDNFNTVTSGSAINGRTTTGGTWVAPTGTFLGNGSGGLSADINQGVQASIDVGAGAFQSFPGVFDLSLDATQPTTPGAASWVAVGFSPSNGTANNFVANNGAPWMLYRNNGQVVVFAGPSNTNSLFSSATGAFATGTTHNLKVELDTTSSAWAVNAFVDSTQLDLNGAAAGNTFTYTSNPTTSHYVAMAVGQNGTTGATLATVDNFLLTGPAVPEPAAGAVMLAGMGLLACRRRRRAVGAGL